MSTIVKSIVKRFMSPVLLLQDVPNFLPQLFITLQKSDFFIAPQVSTAIL